MKTTENKLYIVSFGDSNQYRLETTPEEGLRPLMAVEKEINDYLKSLFPDEPFAYYTEPKALEIDPVHRSSVADYAPLDRNAVEAIKAELDRELQMRDAFVQLNDNAPFNSAGPRTKLAI